MESGATKLISVIIPVYNVERYLENCINSIQNNTYKNLEIICIDDGSSDRSGNILDHLAYHDPRLCIIHQENQGVSVARNKGIERAHGDYYAFVDSDDYVHPLYFETMLNCAIHKKADVVICEYKSHNEEDSVCVPTYTHISYRKLNQQAFYHDATARNMIWGRLYKKEVVGETLFASDVRIADDTLFNLSIIAGKTHPVIYKTDAQLYCYLIRKNSLVHTFMNERLLDFGEWYLRHRTFFPQNEGWNWLVKDKAFKLTLAYRYEASLENDFSYGRKVAKILWECIYELLREKQISVKQKVMYSIMALSPGLYRAYRVHDDPTLMDWEKKRKITQHIHRRDA